MRDVFQEAALKHLRLKNRLVRSVTQDPFGAADGSVTAGQLELRRQYPDLAGDTENRPTPVWHGVCAAILAQTQWGVTDPEILSAGACHTTG